MKKDTPNPKIRSIFEHIIQQPVPVPKQNQKKRKKQKTPNASLKKAANKYLVTLLPDNADNPIQIGFNQHSQDIKPLNWHNGLIDLQIELINAIRLFTWAKQANLSHLPANCANKIFVALPFPDIKGVSPYALCSDAKPFPTHKLLDVIKGLADNLAAEQSGTIRYYLRQVEFLVWGIFYQDPEQKLQHFINKHKPKTKSPKTHPAKTHPAKTHPANPKGLLLLPNGGLALSLNKKSNK